MARIELHPDFKDFLSLLNSHNVSYLMVGGYAVGYRTNSPDLCSGALHVNRTKHHSGANSIFHKVKNKEGNHEEKYSSEDTQSDSGGPPDQSGTDGTLARYPSPQSI
jgi:hypothetical protein